MTLSLAGHGGVHAQAPRQASGQVAPASIEPQMAMATLSPEGQRDAQHWVRYGSWPAGVPVVVTAIDSGRTVRARTAGGISGGGAAMVYSAGVGAALGLNPDRPTALLVRMDTAPGPAPALAAPSAVPTAPAAATAPSALPPATPAPVRNADAASSVAPAISPKGTGALAQATPTAASPLSSSTNTRGPSPSETPLKPAGVKPADAKQAEPKSARAASVSGKALYLQLGAFADEKNAWVLFAKVRAIKLPEGVKSEILQLGGLHRVRVGPFVSRAQRDAVSKQLEDVAGVTPIKLRL